MYFKSLCIVFLFIVINDVYGQRQRKNAWTYYELNNQQYKKNELTCSTCLTGEQAGFTSHHPFRLALRKDSFYFYYQPERGSPNLLNYGTFKKRKKHLEFQEAIRTEGKTVVWEIFIEEEDIFCNEYPFYIRSNGDTTALQESKQGIFAANSTGVGFLAEKFEYSFMLNDTLVVDIDDTMFGDLLVSTSKNKKERILDRLKSWFIYRAQTPQPKSFRVKDDITGIKSPKIHLSNPKPNLVIVDMHYPREAVGSYSTYVYRCFPRSKQWIYDAEEKQIIVYEPRIFTYIDMKDTLNRLIPPFLSTNKTPYSLNDPEDGAFKAYKWIFSEIDYDEEDIITELEKQKEEYKQTFHTKRLMLRTAALDCLEKADSVKISIYDNLPLKEKAIRKNSRRAMETWLQECEEFNRALNDFD